MTAACSSSSGAGLRRAAVVDVPGIDAFGLVTSGQSFVPSAATEQEVTDQVGLIERTYGAKGRAIIADAQAEADGINAYWKANGITQPPATVNDVIAVTAFIGSIFGAGGGAEASNSEFLSQLQASLGPRKGHEAWEDAMLANDPEAPTTITKRFNYPVLTGGKVKGSLVIDAGSVQSLDPTKPLGATPNAGAAPVAPAPADGTNPVAGTSSTYPAAGPVPRREASNFLVVNPSRSATGNTVAVMGPQLGYYYPEIVEQIDLKGPGVQAQGVAVPGAAMYLLIGRTKNYAWSLTSADHDIRDVFAEQLCNPDGTPPTRQSTHYLYNGVCRPFDIFDAGTLNGTPVVYPQSVHGPMIGTATVGGRPYALTRQRSTFGRDGLNLAALKDMTDGRATTPSKFYDTANEFGFTFNWAYASRTDTAYFSSGLLPRRARRPRPAPPDPRHRRLRLARLPQRGRAPARRRRAAGPAAELEQQVGTGLHARRRHPARLGPPRPAVQPVPEPRRAGRRRQRDEPGRDRGHPCAGVAHRQPGPPHRPRAERPRRQDGGRARRLGAARRAASRCER